MNAGGLVVAFVFYLFALVCGVVSLVLDVRARRRFTSVGSDIWGALCAGALVLATGVAVANA